MVANVITTKMVATTTRVVVVRVRSGVVVVDSVIAVGVLPLREVVAAVVVAVVDLEVVVDFFAFLLLKEHSWNNQVYKIKMKDMETTHFPNLRKGNQIRQIFFFR